MPVIAVSALVGILAGLWVPLLSSASWWPAMVILIAPLCWWASGLPALVCWVGVAIGALHSHEYAASLLHPVLVRQDVMVVGYVADFPRTVNGVTTALFAVNAADDPQLVGELVRISVYGTEPQLQSGAGWQLLVRLKQPRSTANPGAFDRELWNFRHRIIATGYVRNSVLNRPVSIDNVSKRLLMLRSRVRDELLNRLQTPRGRALVPGIITGVRQGIDAQTWEVLRRTGTSHLMAISGLHIGLVALLAWFPGRLLGLLAELCGLVRIAPWLGRMTVLLVAGIYTLLAGMTVPTVRAFSMVVIVTLVSGSHRSLSVAGILACALMLVLVLDPLAVLAAGFWLSFLAVAALAMIVLERVTTAPSSHWLRQLGERTSLFIKRAVSVQWALLLALALPTLLFFGQLSVAALPANLLAIPVFSFAVLPLLLVGTVLAMFAVSAATTLLFWGEQILNGLYYLLELLAGLPGVMLQPVRLDHWVFLIAMLAAISALLPKPIPGRLLGAGLLLSIFLRSTAVQEDLLSIRIIDVGQGLAVLLSTRQHNLLYDAGPGWRGGDAGQTSVLPYLRSQGVARLDTMIISHDDADHRGGAQSILAALPVASVMAPSNPWRGMPARQCVMGDAWRWDGVEFTVLHPGGGDHWSDNNGSCVLLVQVGDVSVLLPGDIEAQAERQVIQHAGLAGVDLILAPHHGSATSSSAPFVASLNQSYVVFSVGYANRWNFPVPAVWQRWQQAGSCMFTTSVTGALEFATDDGRRLSLRSAYRSGWSRPWVLRNPQAIRCDGTINGLNGGV